MHTYWGPAYYAYFYLLSYAAVLIKFTYYAQNHAQEELCLVITICIQIFMYKSPLIVDNVKRLQC